MIRNPQVWPLALMFLALGTANWVFRERLTRFAERVNGRAPKTERQERLLAGTGLAIGVGLAIAVFWIPFD